MPSPWIAGECGHPLPIGGDEERASLSRKAGRGNAALGETAADTGPIASDRGDSLSQLLSSRRLQSDPACTAVPGREHADDPAVPDLTQRREQIADDERMPKRHMRRHRTDDDAAGAAKSLQLMQITFLIDRRRIGDAEPREAERFGPLGNAARLAGAAREDHDSVVEAISHGEAR
jgi:hypothetical protein